jgi:hypothetical protein
VNLRLEFIQETPKARLYAFKDGEQHWIPKSVVNRTVKFPAKDLNTRPVHEVTVEDWWWEKYILSPDDDDLTNET